MVVVVVVVRELLFLVTLVICVRIRGCGSEVTTTRYHIRLDFRLKRRSYRNGFVILKWVRTRVEVVMVVVRELFSLVTSAICVRIRGHGLEVTRIVYHIAQFFVHCCVLTTEDSEVLFPLYFAM